MQLPELAATEVVKCVQYMRMDIKVFEELLSMVEKDIVGLVMSCRFQIPLHGPTDLSATRPDPRTKSVHVEIEQTCLRPDKVRGLVGDPSGPDRTLSETSPTKSGRARLVEFGHKLTAADHVSSLLASCSSSMYAMRVLRNHGLPATSLTDVFRATIIAKLINLLFTGMVWSDLST